MGEPEKTEGWRKKGKITEDIDFKTVLCYRNKWSEMTFENCFIWVKFTVHYTKITLLSIYTRNCNLEEVIP